MFTISVPIALLCLIASAAGYPLDDSSHSSNAERTGVNKIFRRQCNWSEAKGDWVCDYWLPSLSQIVDRMQDKPNGGLADVDHSIVFYTSPDIRQYDMCPVIEHWASAQKLTYCWYQNCQNFAWLKQQESWVGVEDFAGNVMPQGLFGDDPHDAYLSCQFQALAIAAVNEDVFFLIPADEVWDEESSWEEYKYWVLTRNPNVERIWRADPDLLLGQPILLWEKGNAATDNGAEPLPPKKYCTVKYTTDPVGWWEWGPGKPIDPFNPSANPPHSATVLPSTESSLNETINRMLGID